MNRAEAYKFLLNYCKLMADEPDESTITWQACIDLLEEECIFHIKMLENRN